MHSKLSTPQPNDEFAGWKSQEIRVEKIIYDYQRWDIIITCKTNIYIYLGVDLV